MGDEFLNVTASTHPLSPSSDNLQEWPVTIGSLFSDAVARNPMAIALTCGPISLTYQQLDSRANQLAHHLMAIGVGPEKLVGICLHRTVDLVVALLGTLKAGGAYVPLDPVYPSDRIHFLLEDSQPTVVLTQQSLRSLISPTRAALVVLESELLLNQSDACPENNIHPEDLAYVIYTSGSTGKPKGVAIEHRNAVALIEWAKTVFTSEELAGVLASTSICFDLSVFEIFVTLCLGGRVILVDNALELSAFPEQSDVTLINTVPSAIRELVRLRAIPESVVTINLAGELLPTDLVNAVYANSKVKRVYDLYGPTEDTVYSTYTLRLPNVPPSIGKPITNTQAYVLDANRKPVSQGEVGELYLGGAGLARGYLNRPDMTADRFINDRLGNVPGGRLYRTGDLARWQKDGNLECLGRIDHQVKIRGFRIEIGEIEAVLSAHPRVKDRAVIAREDTPGEDRLVAYVVTQKNFRLDVADLRQFIQKRLPEYMIPSAFVPLDSLPLTPNGKLDRKALPAPSLDRPELAEVYIAPETPLENQLAQLWSKLLQIDRIGIHDNFLMLGGHSLLAVRFCARIRQKMNIELPVRSVFASPTIAELAKILATPTSSTESPFGLLSNKSARPPEIPLSFAQERLWFLHRLQPHSSFYNIPFALRLQGPLIIQILEKCVRTIVQRHEVLRTTYDNSDGQPAQRIHPDRTVNLRYIDLQHMPHDQRQTEAELIVVQESHRPFDLSQDLPLRPALIQLNEHDFILILTMHHIASDGWSEGVLSEELGSLYSTFAASKPSSLTELLLQYADYALWQRQQFQGELAHGQIHYWKTQLAGAPTLLELPIDYPRPPVQNFRGAIQPILLDKALTHRLKQLGQQQGATLFMTLMALFQVFLNRVSGQEDIVIGAATAGRTHQELEGLIGFFVNTLPIRLDLSGEPTFTEVLQRVRKVTLDGFSHQDIPVEKIVEELRPERSLSYNPLFQVVFSFLNSFELPDHFGDLSVETLTIPTVSSKFDLTLLLMEETEQIRGHLEYNTDLFQAETIARWLSHFQNLLRGITADPQQQIGKIQLMTDSERHMLLHDWNNTSETYPKDSTIHALFQDQVARSPHAIALVLDSKQMSYAELNSQSNQLAHFLRKAGVGPDTVVAFCLERSFDQIVVMLAILKAGGAYLPLNPEYPKERIQLLLNQGNCTILVSRKIILDALTLSSINTISLDTEIAKINQESRANPVGPNSATHLANIIFTSGSTGKPKGVEVVHQGVVRLLFGVDYVKLGSDTRILQLAPLSFDASTFEIWAALLHGGRCILCPDKTTNSSKLTDLIRSNQINTLWLTAALFNCLIEEDVNCLGALKQLLIGGEALSVRHVQIFLENNPDVQLINGYGPTESTTFACCYSIPRKWKGDSVPIGRPISNTTAYVLDTYLNPVPVGVEGELYLGGDGLARGYRVDRDLTSAKFVRDPFSSSGFLYKTGDRTRWRPDGLLEFLGRRDQQIKLRGFRIEPGEIETTLMQHPDIQKAFVMLWNDKIGKNKTLVAYLVANRTDLKSVTIRSYLESRLPDYMIPSAFVVLDAFPITPNGKLDRKALPAPGAIRSNEDLPFVGPRTETETKLAYLWIQLLEVSSVGIHDNFFHLGGHSLKLLSLLHSIQCIFQKTISINQFIPNPTIAQVAKLLDIGSSSNETTQTPIDKLSISESSKPILFCMDKNLIQIRNHLPKDQSLYWLDRDFPYHDQVTIEELASHRIDQLLEMQPHGPYYLFGYSAGGTIAFEMAQQLVARGEKIAFLALMDSPGPIPGYSLFGLPYLWNLFLKRMRNVTIKKVWASTHSLYLDTMKRVFKSITVANQNKPVGDEDLFKLGYIVPALNRYKPKNYQGIVYLFLAKDSRDQFDRNLQIAGWKQLVGENLTTLILNGDHQTFLREPLLNETARLFNKYLNEAQISSQ